MADKNLGIEDLDMSTRLYFQKQMDEHGSVGKDQIKMVRCEDLDEEDDDGITEVWAIDIYEPTLQECSTVFYYDEDETKEDYEILLSLCDDSKVFKIPCSWEMYGHIEVRANSLEEAVEEAESDEHGIPVGSYIEGSFELDYAIIEDMKEENNG